jgi:Tol biopolymer transport system component
MHTVVRIAALATLLSASLAADRAEERKFQQAVDLMETKGNVQAAMKLFEETARSSDRNLAARALLYLGSCSEKLGVEGAQKAYQRIIKEFADQRVIAEQARARLDALGHPGGAQGITVRQVWARSGSDTTGAPSPDGSYLSFVDWGTGDLALRDLATGEQRRLTKKGPWETSSEFALLSVPSPDGKQVAYNWFNKDWRYDLRVVALDGSEPRVLHADPDVVWNQPFDWTADGKQVLAALNRNDGSSELVLISVVDGALRRLKRFEWQLPSRARLSPDGRYIAYDLPVRRDSPAKDIFLMTVAGGAEVPLVQHPADDRSPEWIPDGSRILFASDRTGQAGVWSIRVAGGKPQGQPELLQQDLGRNASVMGLTRKGSLYYGVQTGMQDVHIAELDPATGKIVAPPKPATQRFEGSNASLVWSPDGRQLAYLSRRGRTDIGATLCLRSVDNPEARELALKLQQVPWVRWFPDGQQLLTLGRGADGYGYYRIEPESGKTTPLLVSKGERAWLGWPAAISRDGNALFYLHHDLSDKSTLILFRDLPSGQQKDLYRLKLPAYFSVGVVLSPDDRELAFVVQETAPPAVVLRLIPAAGGEARERLRFAKGETITSLAWTPDGRYLLFGKRPPAFGTAELWRIPSQGGEPQSLGLAMTGLRHLSVHPDGRRIAFSAGEFKSEVWVMENFLPGLAARR